MRAAASSLSNSTLFCSLLTGYLKKHHTTLLSPPLPLHKQHSVQRLGFGTNNKIFVEFESPWWDADCEVIYLVWEDEVCEYTHKHTRPKTHC